MLHLWYSLYNQLSFNFNKYMSSPTLLKAYFDKFYYNKAEEP